MIFVNRLEALAEGIMAYSGYRDPGSELFQARNPGGLRAYSPTVMRDLENYRQFTSLKSGWDALLFDLRTKCSGDSHTSLTPDSTLKDLIRVNGFQFTIASYVATFLQRALQDQTVSENTTLAFFLEV